MQSVQAISLRKVAWLEFAQSLSKWLTIIAVCACVAIVFYIAGSFTAEWLWPPAPVAINSNSPGALLFGADDGLRAHRLVNPGLRWLGRILFVSSDVQVLVAGLLFFYEKPATKKLLGGIAMFFLSLFFAFAASISCGC